VENDKLHCSSITEKRKTQFVQYNKSYFHNHLIREWDANFSIESSTETPQNDGVEKIAIEIHRRPEKSAIKHCSR
jgi:hypothetical protein